MIKHDNKARRDKKRVRIRKRIVGTAQRPRLTVFRSGRHGYAQIIDDMSGRTLVEASTVSKELREELLAIKNPTERYKKLGTLTAKRALEKNITTVVFDRNGYLYHGRVKALADGAREGGLKL
ncbi:MAG: 50S ribosomal protein L18 [Ignavibacteria bacterium GWA2_55_11]|nr:MAG: 50S ribosomal protein L18 [Ignavibacteria bacterium GWA2_55_11]OGU43451.1 MAG: 50S ribosomal protein L18 [Ignavibacteria bacterium GWC2_56_12]OGU64982.1 MAG: 50S ribosomal protein L18 [Ignavibacteria bacterium RIFCSPHIGHO2_02_FULL_56_12]OGU71864.1 MAG: 50S ribosomal protein L18 [Ignavibacteria bacterium RIFCSPLOWO2_12_FULL_56_21]OGU74631.1 MAG: 50S ribosomal protein L18 [Ignavibacteria bacterium RIFCSPLOWO2_02_FULL_55_14]HAV24145.1 50S ribosomal protein L18 [Bacteroidota bacterium]